MAGGADVPRGGYEWATGKYGKVTWNGTTIHIKRWSFTEGGGDDADVTHSGSSGVKQSQVVNTAYTGSFTGVWDLRNQPTGSNLNLRRGQIGTLNKYISREAYIGIGDCEIKSIAIESVVSDVVTFTVSFQTNTEPTMPGATLYSSSSSSSSSSSTTSSSS
jgi:hypothetical protein